MCVGQVAGQDEDNNRVMLRLALTGEIINISQHNMQLVSKTDYNKYSKYLSETTYSCTVYMYTYYTFYDCLLLNYFNGW